MKSDQETSAAYRASQFILNNVDLIFCNCKDPMVTSNKIFGCTKSIKVFCYNCKKLIKAEHVRVA